MNLQTTQQILKARDFLQSISQISFSFSTLNRQFPMQSLEGDNSQELIRAYIDLINKVRSLSNEYENGTENTK
jgi:hypothetical protein